MTLETVLETVLVQVDEYQRTGRPRPAWLQRKVDAVYNADMITLLEGLIDERDALNAARYTAYGQTND